MDSFKYYIYSNKLHVYSLQQTFLVLTVKSVEQYNQQFQS